MIFKKSSSRIKKFITYFRIHFLPNPDSAPEGTETVTSDGVRKAFIRLFLFLFLGCMLSILFNVLKNIGFLKSVHVQGYYYWGKYDGDICFIESLFSLVAAFFFVIMPFLRYIYRWLKVTGPVYALSIGYIYCYSFQLIKGNLMDIIVLSIVLALVLCLFPIFLLLNKDVQPPKYMSRITCAAFAVVTFGGSIMQILNQIPFICILAGHIIDLSEYREVRIFGDGLKVFISFLFISLAFARIREYIRKGVSRKYEWMGVFTGFYTVSIIMVKIQEILYLIIG